MRDVETREIARLLRDAGRLGTGEIVEATGRLRPWVLDRLRQLEAAEVIERVGKGPNDPGPTGSSASTDLGFETRSLVLRVGRRSEQGLRVYRGKTLNEPSSVAAPEAAGQRPHQS